MTSELDETLGFIDPGTDHQVRQRRLQRYLNFKLAAHGQPTVSLREDSDVTADTERLLARFHSRLQLLDELRCPADERIEAFLDRYLSDLDLSFKLQLPARTMILDRHGLARELSVPADGDRFSNEVVDSYRVRNGVLHNPVRDRRTTKGTFHITAGGLPIPHDKQEVPPGTFAALFRLAMQPPDELMTLPFAAQQAVPARAFVSLLIRPLVSPAVEGIAHEMRMETRFFAPGGLVANLDFVESIFGNAGDPFLPENDAGLDVQHWTGHTGAVILAPHLTTVTKKEVGLPPTEDATERQQRDGMCWSSADELYNDGLPFKLTCRDEQGVIVTLIADNYFGYCKKEVKTQISYAANLMGNAEEEHAGGTIAYASFNLGDEFVPDERLDRRMFSEVVADYSDLMHLQDEGYGIDRQFPDLLYIPEDARASLHDQRVKWTKDGSEQSIPLLPGKVYMRPSGFKLRMERHPETPTWRLIGTQGEGLVCHKPCTVSGGGKSEISKSLVDYMLYGPFFVADLEKDLDLVQQIFDRDYSIRWRSDMPDKPSYDERPSRRVLDPDRSLGSVIKLLTPSPDYTEEYLQWLASIPDHIYALVFVIKRFHMPDWEHWREHFSVDIVNGTEGHELKYNNRKLVGTYLRVGLEEPNIWRTYKVRQDFAAAEKIQTEDDISASIVLPADKLTHLGLSEAEAISYKFVENCESRLFQRPDDAVHRGLDKQAEADLARGDNFISNFEPLSHRQVSEMAKYVVDLDKFTAPMQELLRTVDREGKGYVVCSSSPRIVDGKPTKNPRYLQARPDLVKPMNSYVARVGTRLARAVPRDTPAHLPVNSVLLGRRNNPPNPQQGIRSLAVYNPIHYQELPELFMDFVSSLTGKSPSTTGAGSEGALTKGPFNCLQPITDLNNALVSFVLTNLAGFSTAAGHVGPHIRVDHDISYLVPEVWCRLRPAEREPQFLIEEGMLEKIDDFSHNGETIKASRLGYRITYRFIRWFFGRVFDNPSKVFDEAILKPETQDPEAFADGVQHITEAHQRIAKHYFSDGSIELACPPLKALLTIMAEGSVDGMDEQSPELRRMFSAEYLLGSDWYRQRLEIKQQRDVALLQRHVDYAKQFLEQSKHAAEAQRLDIAGRLEWAEEQLSLVAEPFYLDELHGMIGADPSLAGTGSQRDSTMAAVSDA